MNQQAVKIQEKLMIVRLNCAFSFGRVTDKQITRETNADKRTRSLLVKKEILPGVAGTELRALQGTLAEFYKYHSGVTMSSVNDGERLLPALFQLDYRAEYTTYQPLVQEAFQNFKDTYPTRIYDAQPLLNEAWNRTDYPDMADLEKKLHFKLLMLPLPDAGPLLNALGECIQSDTDDYIKQAMKSGFAEVHSRIQKELERMVEQLSDPKKKVFNSLTENLAELVSKIPAFNVVEDDSLVLLADEVTKLLRVGPNDLRTNDAARQETAAAAAEILRRMGV